MDNYTHASELNFKNFRVETRILTCMKLDNTIYGVTVLTSRRRNRLQRALNGNGVTYPILFQNIPGKCGPDRVGDIITDILSRFDPLVLIIAETRSDVVASKTPSGYTHVPGTLKWRKNPRVSLLIKDGVKYKHEEPKTDIPLVSINLDGWRIVGYYREWCRDGIPDTDAIPDQLERLQTLTSFLKKSKKQGRTIALGDMNVDLYNLTDYQKRFDTLRYEIEEELIANGWLQLVKDVTRSQTKCRDSCIDHIYTTHHTHVDYIENVNVSGTDHNMIGAHLSLDTPVFVPHTFAHRNIDAIPDGKFEAEFLRGDISEVYNCRDPNLCAEIFEFKIVRTLNKLAPERMITTKPNHAPWMTPDLKKLVSKRDKMRKKAIRSKLKDDWFAFKTFQKEVAKKKIEAKNSYYVELLQKGTSKDKWNQIQKFSKYQSRKKGGKNVGEMEIVNNEGFKMTDPEQLSDFMNRFFKSKVSNLQKDLNPDPIEATKYTEEFIQNKKVPEKCFRPVAKKTIKRLIRSLKNTGAVGRDKISTKVLKKYCHVIAPPLTHLVNLCLQKQKFPEVWKIGLIRPLPKGGDLTEAKSWRPIVLNCILSKILEGVINEQLMEHLESNNLFSSTQHAYRRDRSVSSALQDYNTIQADMRNRGLTIALLTTDVSAGFNLVSKHILIPKLEKLGLDHSACALIFDYLSNRRTRCCIGGAMSDEITLDTGVGEGSCLGPVCFSCSMCCISRVAVNTVKRMEEEHNINTVEAFTDEFADDASGILGARSEEDLQIAIDIMLEEFKRYYSVNGLCLNVKKCQVLIHRVKPKISDLYCGERIPENKEQECIRLLGLQIDKDLTYDVHCRKVIGSCYEKLAAIKRLVGFLPLKDLIRVTESLILSSVEWAAEIWLQNKKNQVKVQRLLNSTMRTILGKTLKDRMRVTDMLCQVEWLNSPNLARRAQLTNLRRIIYKRVAPYSFGVINADISDKYNFREVNEVRGVRCRWLTKTRFVRSSFLLPSITLYNSHQLNICGRHFEDEREFRLHVTEKLKSIYGNSNI